MDVESGTFLVPPAPSWLGWVVVVGDWGKERGGVDRVSLRGAGCSGHRGAQDVGGSRQDR